MKFNIRNAYNEFKSGKSPILGIWIILVFACGSLFLFPWLFSLSSFLPSFENSGQIGDTINGIAGPFIALAAALLTFLAFWVQFQANQEQKKQFEKQNQDQIFFKLLESQESRVINSSFVIKEKESKSYQLLEKIVEDYKQIIITNYLPNFARNLIVDNFELLDDTQLYKIFELYYIYPITEGNPESAFEKEKSTFLARMKQYERSDRWEYIKDYFNSVGSENGKQRQVLIDIGTAYFYKISFNKRFEIYKAVFDEIEQTYGSFLDGYLRGWEFIGQFINESNFANSYSKFAISQISKFEMIILFNYISSGYAGENFKVFVKQNNILNKLHFYNDWFVDLPSEDELKNELLNILN